MAVQRGSPESGVGPVSIFKKTSVPLMALVIRFHWTEEF